MARALTFSALLALLIIAGILGCSDSTSPVSDPVATGQFRLYLVDAPGDYDAVNVVVDRVLVHPADDEEDAEGEKSDDLEDSWVTVSADPDTIDLLQYADGTAFVLADAVLEVGEYTQIRLMIGEGSNVVVAGEVFDLEVPSGAESGLKLVHDFVITEAGRYEATLDFDADKSVHRTGHGLYKLTPVIRMVTGEEE